jgi:hypothetical protein
MTVKHTFRLLLPHDGRLRLLGPLELCAGLCVFLLLEPHSLVHLSTVQVQGALWQIEGSATQHISEDVHGCLVP